MHRVRVVSNRIRWALLILLPLTSLVCSTLSGGTSGGQPAEPTAAEAADKPAGPLAAATRVQPTVPADWKVSTDASGQCRVSTPPEWQLGTDFFLAAEQPGPGPVENSVGVYPPSAAGLWGIAAGTPAPEGTWFQIRASLTGDEVVCSVWRTRGAKDFSEDEKSQLQQVGQTLQVVQ